MVFCSMQLSKHKVIRWLHISLDGSKLTYSVEVYTYASSRFDTAQFVSESPTCSVTQWGLVLSSFKRWLTPDLLLIHIRPLGHHFLPWIAHVLSGHWPAHLCLLKTWGCGDQVPAQTDICPQAGDTA